MDDMRVPSETIRYSLPDVVGAITLVDRQVVAHFWEDRPTRATGGEEERIVEMLRDYFAGRNVDPVDWKVGLTGLPPFHIEVYCAVREVRRGQIATYAQIARAAGSPRAARAVGNALARNPIPLFVPCHRVKSESGLGGWSGPPHWKERLLALESAPDSEAGGRVKTGGTYR